MTWGSSNNFGGDVVPAPAGGGCRGSGGVGVAGVVLPDDDGAPAAGHTPPSTKPHGHVPAPSVSPDVSLSGQGGVRSV
jgi:hypothetical protein